ncbi:hypothetical protein C7212DRAFT_359950 [Tuber magnatum]|uniref:Amino acid permease/ SLC12A domain-containing protein n=1 Tax=Tuber magnatum TaxID=42249 RepID=A0A317SDN7_9PEZI|nr:hypothetical protein C7212DRAFT_359950 [Tuber magnatum]
MVPRIPHHKNLRFTALALLSRTPFLTANPAGPFLYRSLSTGGPFSVVFSFAWLGLVLTTMMQCLCEMTTIYPASGSFVTYAARYIDPAWGFAVGALYWACWVGAFGTEATAARILVGYWLPVGWSDDPTHAAILISVFNFIMVLIHVFPVRVFGEIEFWISSIKVVSVLVFLVVIWVIMGGGGPDGRVHGGEYWAEGALINGFKGLSSVFVTAAFACGGTEVAGVAGGETKDPMISMPRAVRTLMFRIVFFYVVTLLFLSFVVSARNPALLGSESGGAVEASPFVIAIKEAGIGILPDVLNAIVLLCVSSVGSVSIYTASRVLYNMTETGLISSRWGLGEADERGRPIRAIIATTLIAVGLSYMNCSASAATAFTWFTSLSGIAFLACWPTIIASNWRWRAGIKAQGLNILDLKYAYKASFRPWLPAFGFVSLLFMLVCHIYVSASPVTGSPNAGHWFQNCLGIPLIVVFFGGYKILYRTKFVNVDEMDLQTDKMHDSDIAEQSEKLDAYYGQSRKVRTLSYVRF